MPVIALDIGGTKIAAAAFDAAGDLQVREEAGLEGREGKAVGALAVELLRSVAAALEADGAPLEAVGAGVPGVFRAATGTVWAPNIPGWKDYPLLGELQAVAGEGVAVRVDSDRACCILGEVWLGAAKGARDAIFLSVGTGIGAGILVDGRVLRGRSDIAGAIGWMALSRPWLEPYRDVGCLEYHASGPGLATVSRQMAEVVPNYGGTLARGAASLTGRDVFAAAAKGDRLAARVIEDAVAYWGMAVANLVSVFNPEKIVFGGGVFGPAVRYLPEIRAEAERWAQPLAMREVALEPAALGADAALAGAARLALNAVASGED